MNNKILLSICIPTYNRAHYLKNCLNSIVCQFKNTNITNQIEIVISDNASQDNTQKLVKEYQAQFNNIKYFRNKENLGFDKNIINSVLKAKGQYCWYLGDDDLIKNGGLKFIINFLQKNESDLLTILSKPFSDINEVFQEDTKINNKLILYCDSYEEFFRKVYCHGVLGIFIFNRNLWLRVNRRNYEKFWSYFEIILKMMPLSNLKFAHLKYPVLFTGQDYKWNKNGSALFILIHWKRVINKLRSSGYSKNLVKNQLKQISSKLPMTLLIAKSHNLKYSFSNLSLIYKEFYKHPFWLFLATIIFFIPNFLIKFLVFLKKNV